MSEEYTHDLLEWLQKSTQIFVKKLSRNDCRWADSPENGHQNGFYVPRQIRESDYFPPLLNINPAKAHIFETTLIGIWPTSGQLKTSRAVHYSNKGTEMHLTRVPKEEFVALAPASILVSGRLRSEISGASHWFMVIDSESDQAEWLETILDLDVDFQFGLFDPNIILRGNRDEASGLIAELEYALKSGTLSNFIAEVCCLPTPAQLAAEAQTLYLRNNNLKSLDPWTLATPGDTLMVISRDIEFSIYKKKERAHRAAEVLAILAPSKERLAEAVVNGFAALDATFLSASQHRKSRAGRSFEHHISAMLRAGKIPFEEQAVTGGRRPDFVLPSLSSLENEAKCETEALILSAKTTLRERWKQVTLENFKSPIFLGTVDDRISADSINDMKRHGITLVVPEKLKIAKETCYENLSNVITFRDFFDNQVEPRLLKFWASQG